MGGPFAWSTPTSAHQLMGLPSGGWACTCGNARGTMAAVMRHIREASTAPPPPRRRR